MDRVNSTLEDLNEFTKKEPAFTVKDLKCQDLTCGVIFLCFMFTNLIMSGVSIYNGNFLKIGLLVDSSNVACNNGSNRGYPYLYYTQPCDTHLGDKICVENCPSISSPSLNSPYPCTGSTFSTNIDCNAQCAIYDSYPYLDKVCVPTQPDNLVEGFLLTHDSAIVMSNIRVAFSQILYVGAIIVAVSLVTYVVQAAAVSAIYAFAGVSLVGILFMAFCTLKVSQVRYASILGDYPSNNLLLADENRQQSLSFLLFAIYLVCFPLILILKDRLTRTLQIMGPLKEYFLCSGQLHVCNVVSIVTICIQISFEIFVLINFYSNGLVIPSSSPFYSHTRSLVNVASEIFMFVGAIWLVSFSVSFHQYIVSSYTSIWYSEEQIDSHSFNPLARSLKRSYYNFGSIALDSIIYPFGWLMMALYSFIKVEPENSLPEEVQEENTCAVFVNDLMSKLKAAIEVAYKYTNRGVFPCMSVNNLSYTESCRQYASLHSEYANKFHGLGSIISLYNGLFVVLVSVILSYFVLFFTVLNTSTPPPMSSLIVPLTILFVFAIAVGCVGGTTFGFGLDTVVYCCLLGVKKPDRDRMAYEVNRVVEKML